MRKKWLIQTICILLLIISCKPGSWSSPSNPMRVISTLAVSGLEGIPQPQHDFLLEGVTSFSAKVQSPVTGQDIILGFDSNNTPRLIGIFDDKQRTWLWKTIGLRDLADQIGLEIGSGIEGEMFSMPEFYEILNKDFNMVTIHTSFYWYGLEAKQGLLNFDNVDWHVARIKDSANNPDIIIRGHPLIWYSSNPKWFDDGQFTRDEMITIMQDHVTALVGKYAGTITEWVVVNEPYRDIDIYAKQIGPEYIDLAFQAARAAAPSAILILNDVNNETPTSTTRGPTSTVTNGYAGENTQQTVEIIRRLKNKGLVDGVGLQMHLDGANPPSREDVIQTMKNYEIPVYVTELDVDLSDVTGTQQERFDIQADIYGEILEACLESGVCKSFTLWGIGDKYSWLERDLWRHDSDSTLYDDHLNPKTAYFTLLRILANALGAEPEYKFP